MEKRFAILGVALATGRVFAALGTLPFSTTFAKDGSYNYMCIPHPWMTGQINVTK